MDAKSPWTVVSDWDLLQRVLPEGWQAHGWDLGALRRRRGITDPALLLRLFLIHLACGCSLVETAARARQAGLCRISAVGLHKRLRAAEQWLRWLAEELWRSQAAAQPLGARRLRVVDATVVSEPGRSGAQWRVHYAIDLASLQCDFFELTNARGGETFARLPLRPGDVILGDRGYARAPGIAAITGNQGDVLVRLHVTSLPLFTRRGQRFPLLTRLRELRIGAVGDWPAWVHGPHGPIAGRLVALKRSGVAAARVRARMERRARHKQHALSPQTIEAAGYVLLWTTLPRRAARAQRVLEAYRWRWQIELAIKRMKSLLGLGQLPKRCDAGSRAWLHGKLFVALLLERIWREAESVSPWGYPLEAAPQPLA